MSRAVNLAGIARGRNSARGGHAGAAGSLRAAADVGPLAGRFRGAAGHAGAVRERPTSAGGRPSSRGAAGLPRSTTGQWRRRRRGPSSGREIPRNPGETLAEPGRSRGAGRIETRRPPARSPTFAEHRAVPGPGRLRGRGRVARSGPGGMVGRPSEGERRMRSRPIAVAVLAAVLAACTGGGGAPPTTSMPPTPSPSPTPAPTPAPTPTPDPDRAKRGVITAPGIGRIPLDALKVTNREMRGMFAIMEHEGLPTDPDSVALPGVRRTPHSDDVRITACHSYIRACEDPFGPDAPFQFHLGVRYPGGGQHVGGRQQIEKIIRDLPDTVKIVSVSFGGSTPSVLLGDNLRFASIEPTGNEDRETYLAAVFNAADIQRRRDTIRADKLLLVSGYRTTETANGTVYERDAVTGCKGEVFTDGCIWAPNGYHYPPDATKEDRTIDFGGTSAATPHVAAALASVLAVFPDTSPQDLIRLAKACAIETPSLPGGVGRADFACMTTMNDAGEWRVVSDDEFAALLSPDRMSGIVFPGDARITGTFVGRNGKPVTLGTWSRGAFAFTAGVPGVTPGRAAGVFPVAADGAGNPSVGFGYMAESGLFAAAAWGSRPGFFGLGKRYGYVAAAAFDASAGHRNAYVRLSRQTSSAPYVRKVRGDALGVTATGTFEVGARTWLTLSAHMDRFLGGRAAMAFGPVSIDASPWNGAARLFAERRIEGGGAVTLTVDRLWPGRGRGETSVKAGYAVRF